MEIPLGFFCFFLVKSLSQSKLNFATLDQQAASLYIKHIKISNQTQIVKHDSYLLILV